MKSSSQWHELIRREPIFHHPELIWDAGSFDEQIAETSTRSVPRDGVTAAARSRRSSWDAWRERMRTPSPMDTESRRLSPASLPTTSPRSSTPYVHQVASPGGPHSTVAEARPGRRYSTRAPSSRARLPYLLTTDPLQRIRRVRARSSAPRRRGPLSLQPRWRRRSSGRAPMASATSSPEGCASA